MDITKHIEAELRESQRTLSTLMSNLPGIVFLCRNNLNWTMEFVSSGCIELTGYTPEDLTADRRIAFGQLIHPDHRLSAWEKIQKTLNKNTPYQRAYRIITKAGEEKWVWEKGRGVFSDSGKLLALQGFIADITKYKKNEAELKRHRNHLEELVEERTAELSKANQRLRQEVTERRRTLDALHRSNETMNNILAASPIGISLVENGAFTWANAQLCKLFGFTRESDYRGKPIRIIFSSDAEFRRVMDAISLSFDEEGEPFKLDALMKSKDYKLFEGHVRLSCSNPADPLVRAILTVSDITWRKIAEQDQMEREKLQGALEMAGAVCHEMNQPLQELLMVIDDLSLENHPLTKEIDTIKMDIMKIRKITSQLMRITRYRTRDYVDGKKIIDIDGASEAD